MASPKNYLSLHYLPVSIAKYPDTRLTIWMHMQKFLKHILVLMTFGDLDWFFSPTMFKILSLKICTSWPLVTLTSSLARSHTMCSPSIAATYWEEGRPIVVVALWQGTCLPGGYGSLGHCGDVIVTVRTCVLLLSWPWPSLILTRLVYQFTTTGLFLNTGLFSMHC